VAYDDAWPGRFRLAAAGLAAVLGDDWLVEHVGSTSVPGLVAKPVIDLAVRVPMGLHVGDVDGALAGAGWVEAPTAVSTHEVRMQLSGRVRTHIAHFFAADAWDTVQQRLFADWLRRHPEDRHRYAELKTTAWADGARGRAYTVAKSVFVKEVVDKARASRGLPPAGVGDKG
jgi:GrpB-like predicted nucleotidyltransferase (UPF0157 family)